MRDWANFVRFNLADLALNQQQQDDVVAELATHLEDHYEALLRAGTREDEAARRAMLQAGD